MNLKQSSKLLLAAAVTLGTGTAIVSTSVPVEAARKKTMTRKAKSRYTKYTGTVGKYRVTMYLAINSDDTINGYYYYGKGTKGKLQLKGIIGLPSGPACRTISMTEYYNGRVTGKWDVYLNGMTVTPGVKVWNLYGDMTTTSGRTYDVELWAE